MHSLTPSHIGRTRNPSARARELLAGSYQKARDLVTKGTDSRFKRHEPSFQSIRATRLILQLSRDNLQTAGDNLCTQVMTLWKKEYTYGNGGSKSGRAAEALHAARHTG